MNKEARSVPPLFAEGSVEVRLVSIEDFPEPLFEQFSLLSSDDRIAGFRRKRDRIRTLVGEMLVRYAAADYRRLPVEEIAFEREERGKPFLAGGAAGFHFNISHSGSWVAAAFARSGIGVDVERHTSIDPDIAKRFFADQEWKYVFSHPAGEREKAFFKIWTLKESYIKALGGGLSIPLDSFSTVENGSGIRCLQSETTGSRYFSAPDFADGYSLAVCAAEPNEPLVRVIAPEYI
ncbi:4'-phosphopantetheinyl transferase superfamily protein [Saccharibacillus sp. CPCC 101409]|uniref:4'-phosphopantetheinyl transferase family protein n=1 Tax=Saccharibacillus sp. CPCC 101409 TaxID=3058041 RepID=UPI0026725C80|nr:4'-phosphopantetheinyl transferase superfamily protein [Saccharibacillus sp. CPCC 101409]MDO3410485.1 4'-phosphopantetheinyl transferase superfamily protein [Saccharibacillus sp. CPCC 101409]